MVKNTTLREDKVLKEIEKTFPTYRFGNYLDMARLIQPNHFKYRNRSRLETQFTENIKQTLADISLLIQHLDKKHQSEIFSSGEFNEFLRSVIRYSKSSKVDDDYLASFYPNLVKHGIVGITSNLPKEFTTLIDEHLKPLMNLLESITAYSKQVGKKGDIAYGSQYQEWL